MNNIGFGILCFGEDYYYKGAEEKIGKILAEDFHCYLLTEKPEYFSKNYSSKFLHIIPYNRQVKSYYDKMILPKFILKNHDYCVLIDADLHIINYDFIKDLKDNQLGYGITYIDTLKNHPSKKEFVKEIEMGEIEWSSYKLFAEKIYPNFGNMETIWEYLLIINKIGFNQTNFYKTYEKLQVAKEFCDLTANKDIVGAGEGISIAIAAKLSSTDIQRDINFYEKHKDSFTSVSRRFTNPEYWPDWMK